jgi:hypothetical protein
VRQLLAEEASRRAKGEGVTHCTAILNWLQCRKELATFQTFVSQLESKANKVALPDNLRPATASDVKVGAIIWYKHGDEDHFWQMVEEVHYPDDAFKAYTAHDGCRYGLDDAWVEL